MIHYHIQVMGHRSQDKRDASDALAASLSSLCLFHCLLLPLGLVLVPAFAGVSADALHGPGWLHWVLILLAAPASVHALWRGMALHGDQGPWRQAALGFVMMALGALAHADGLVEQVLTVVGGLLVAHAHWRNWKARAAAA
jgi:hypothetical protein